MNEILTHIPERSKSKFLKKYNSDLEHQHDLLKELQIGYFLSRTGLEIEYDKAINGKTPDWTVLQNGKPVCIIEVLTINPEREITTNNELITELSQNLRKIKGKHVIECEVLSNTKVFAAKKELNTILSTVNSWLNTDLCEDLKIDEFNITFQKTSLVSPTDRCEIIFIGALNHKPLRFRSKVLEKIYSYKDIIEQNKIPFIIAVASDMLNMIDEIDFKQIIWGTEVMDIRFGDDFPILYSQMDGLFYDYSNILSGIIWAPFEVRIKKMELHINTVGSSHLQDLLFSIPLKRIIPSP